MSQPQGTPRLIVLTVLVIVAVIGTVIGTRTLRSHDDGASRAAPQRTSARPAPGEGASVDLPRPVEGSPARTSMEGSEGARPELKESLPYGDWGATAELMEPAVIEHVMHFVKRVHATRSVAGWPSKSGGRCVSLEQSRFGERINELPGTALDAMMVEIAPLQSTLDNHAEEVYQLAFSEIQRLDVVNALLPTAREAQMFCERRAEQCGTSRTRFTSFSVVTVGERYYPFMFCGSDYPEIENILEVAADARDLRDEIVVRVLDEHEL